jgi:hypothetical protein
MKRKSVGALLSALVFPGVGQFYLGRRGRGLLFVVPTAVAALLYLNFALGEASGVADQLLSGKLGADPAAIEALLAARPTPPSVTVAGIVLVACWIGSIVEALVARPRP